MGDPNKTVFISYRRQPSSGDARTVYQYLRNKRYDVFMDVESLPGGEFGAHLREEIAKRSHFLLILTHGSAERLANDGDWMRLEIEVALKHNRNIVPLLFNHFTMEAAKPYLTGTLESIASLNALSVPHDFFEAAMERLRKRYMKAVNSNGTQPARATTEVPVIEPKPIEPPKKPESLIAEEYLERAYVRLNKGDLARAIEDFTMAIEMGLKTAEVYLDRAQAYMNKADDELALKDVNEALKFQPRNSHLYDLRGNIYYYMAKYDLAMKDFDKALELDPNLAPTYNSRGNVYSMQGEYERAIEEYSKAIACKPDYVEAYDNRGLTYSDMGDYVKAIAEWGKALQLKPFYYQARINRAIARAAQGDDYSAIEDYNEAIRVMPIPFLPDAYFNRSGIFTKIRDLDRAINDYTQVINLNPVDYEAHNLRGNLWADKGNYLYALGDLSEAISLKPDYAFAYIDRGLVRSRIGDQDSAIADYNEALKLRPSDALAYNNRSFSYYQKGDYQQALKDAEEAIKLDPEMPTAYGCRGSAYFGLCDYQKALDDFKKKDSLIPGDEYATIGIAISHHVMGNKEEAKKIWQDLIKLDPIYKDPLNLPIFQIHGVMEEEAKRLIASL